MSIDSGFLELYQSAMPFLVVYPNYDLKLLPDWLQENIMVARVFGDQKKGVILPDGRKFNLDNHLNDLTGKEWTFFINSVFTTAYTTNGKDSYAHHIRKIHPTPKPPQLMRDIISFFTKKGELVFDSFMGVGGSLLGAALCGRKSAGIELNPQFIEAYEQSADFLNLPKGNVWCGDCIEGINSPQIMQELTEGKQISLLLIDPPYSNMMSKEKTGADISVYGNVSTPFTRDSRDLGNMSKQNFLEALKSSVECVLPYIKFRGYIVVFIKDLQPSKKELNLLHYDVIAKLNEIPNIYYKGMKIWADGTTKLYPYGYPFCFVANQMHQYILIFRKEK